MSSSIKLYTIGNMEQAVVDSATSEATGYPKENLIDNNLDTAWKPTSTAAQTIVFDLQEALIIDYIYLFVRNYASVTAGSFVPQYSDDDITYYNASASRAIGNLTGAPHRLYEITLTASAHRYWQLVMSSLSGTLPEISAAWWASEYDLNQGNEWPENDVDRFFNKVMPVGGGRKFPIRLNRKSSKIMSRIFKISGNTNFNALRNAHQDSAGDACPLVIQEGAAYTDIKVVRFDGGDFDQAQNSYQIYDPAVTFIEEPYIDSGDSY